MTKNSKTLIIFDLVSTLTDAGPRYAAAFARVCNDNGINPPREDEVLDMLGNKNLKQITDYFASTLDSSAKKGFMTECNKTCDALLYDVHWVEKLFPHVREALKNLKGQGYTLGIYTGTREEALDNQLRYHNIEQYFDRRYVRAKDNRRDGMVNNDDLKAHQLKSIHMNWKNSGGTNIVVIGDSVTDVKAAAQCGLSFIGFSENNAKADKLMRAGAQMVFKNFSQLETVLENKSKANPSARSLRGNKPIGRGI